MKEGDTIQSKKQNYMVYCRHKDDKRFLPMDISRGVQVRGLLYASIIHPEKYDQVKDWVDKLNEEKGDFTFELRPIRIKRTA